MGEQAERPSVTQLLERPADADYVAEWTELLRHEQPIAEGKAEISVVVFRLCNEWLAINTSCFAEVSESRNAHRIPHRSNSILYGLVNLRGQLRLCIALHALLEIEPNTSSAGVNLSKHYKRFLSINNKGYYWAFPVDDVYGICRCEKESLQNVPVSVLKSTANYLRGVIQWNGKDVGYLDEELLFESLKRSVL